MNFRRIFRIFLWLSAGFLTLLLAAVVYFYFVIQNIKDPLLAQLESYVDGKIMIGDAKARFFPLGIDLKDVQLFAPDATVPAAKIDSAEMRFNLFPLFEKKIQTTLTIHRPQVSLVRPAKGPSNFETIFKPLMTGEKRQGSLLDNVWWKRLEVSKLVIDQANFVSIEGNKSVATEMKNISIEAEGIQFESKDDPAMVKLSFELPRVSPKPMTLSSQIFFHEGLKKLDFIKGKFSWSPLNIDFHGDANLADSKNQNIPIQIQFASNSFELSALAKNLKQPMPASGKVQVQGTASGSAFAPVLDLRVSSPALTASGKTLSNFQAAFRKNPSAIEIRNSSFGIYGGSVAASGTVNTAKSSAQLNTSFNSLSLAAISGKPGNSARLSGKMNLNIPNYQNPQNFSGSGPISVGPFPIPSVNLKNKVRVAQIFTTGAGMQNLINLGMLSSSSNLTGTQIPSVNAQVRVNGADISFAPFQMNNDHISASGSGNIAQQKTVSASGTATLNGGVTAQLLPDPRFRSYLTQGKNVLAVPFRISGALENPQFEIDSQYLEGLFAKAAAVGLSNILAGGLNPNQLLNSALKNTPLGDPKNPLNQILGAVTQDNVDPRLQGSPQRAPSQNIRQNSYPQDRNTQPSRQQNTKPLTGNRALDQLLFGR